MQDTDRTTFNKAWDLGRGSSPATADEKEFAFRILSGYEINDILKAVKAHKLDPNRGSFPIDTSDVVRQIEGDPDERAAKAWQRVVNAIQSHGPYKKLVFDDAAIHAALDGGMWANLCSCDSYHDLNFRQKEFEISYKAAIGGSSYPGVVCAIPQDDDEIHYIGDEQKARHVLEFASQRELYGPQHISGYLA